VVITATILLLECDAREHDRTVVSLCFLGCSSLYRISIMGVFSRYYHLFNQNFTGQCDTAVAKNRSGGYYPTVHVVNAPSILSKHKTKEVQVLEKEKN